MRVLMVRGIGPGRENMQIDDMFMSVAVVMVRMMQMKMRGQDGQHEQRDDQHPADLPELIPCDSAAAHPASVAEEIQGVYHLFYQVITQLAAVQPQ